MAFSILTLLFLIMSLVDLIVPSNIINERFLNTQIINFSAVTTEKTQEILAKQKDKQDYNEYDNDYERDSEEDILSSKKKLEKIQDTTLSPIEDENNSKPKNVYRWFRL